MSFKLSFLHHCTDITSHTCLVHVENDPILFTAICVNLRRLISCFQPSIQGEVKIEFALVGVGKGYPPRGVITSSVQCESFLTYIEDSCLVMFNGKHWIPRFVYPFVHDFLEFLALPFIRSSVLQRLEECIGISNTQLTVMMINTSYMEQYNNTILL